MMDIEKIIARVKKFKSLKRDSDVADLLGDSPTNFSNKKKRETLIASFINWGINENVNLHWLLTGEENQSKSSKAEMEVHDPIRQYGRPKIHHELLEKFSKIPEEMGFKTALNQLADIFLSGDTGLINAISANLDQFSRNAALQNEIKNLNIRMNELEKIILRKDRREQNIGPPEGVDERRSGTDRRGIDTGK